MMYSVHYWYSHTQRNRTPMGIPVFNIIHIHFKIFVLSYSVAYHSHSISFKNYFKIIFKLLPVDFTWVRWGCHGGHGTFGPHNETEASLGYHFDTSVDCVVVVQRCPMSIAWSCFMWFKNTNEFNVYRLRGIQSNLA